MMPGLAIDFRRRRRIMLPPLRAPLRDVYYFAAMSPSRAIRLRQSRLPHVALPP